MNVRLLAHYSVVLFIALLILTASTTKAISEVNDDYAFKISLENQLEKKLKQVIAEITGTDKVVIFVNTEVTSKGSDRERSGNKSDALVLPGVPAKKEIGSSQSSGLMLVGARKYSVNKIILSIWIDSTVPGSIVDLIQDIAKNVIGFSQSRGDLITIKKVDFESKGFFRTIFAFPNFLLLILTIVGGFALIALGTFFMNPLKKAVPALKEIDWSQIRGGGSSTTIEMTAPVEREVVTSSGAGPAAQENAPGAQGDETRLPFAFIREKDITSLAFLLKDKSPQDISVVVNYLDPALAVRLLELFPIEKQSDVALMLSKEEINLEKVRILEEEIKRNLLYVVGGESKLITLLDMVGEDVRESAVKKLEATDAGTGARVKQRIKSIENILTELPAAGIQTLYRKVDAALFAQILNSLASEVQQKVLASLSAGAADRLKEEMKLSRPLSAARLKRERQNLIGQVRRLITEGIVEVENN